MSKTANSKTASPAKFTRTNLTKMLSSGVAQITFTKANGKSRILKGTLQQQLIPARMRPKTDTKAPIATGLVTAFDMEIDEWRSFHASSVTDAKVLERY